MEKLNKWEKLALEILAEECREELAKGIPPAVISPVCNQCAKRVPGAKCSEYPDGIPDQILFKESECKKFCQK